MVSAGCSFRMGPFVQENARGRSRLLRTNFPSQRLVTISRACPETTMKGGSGLWLASLMCTLQFFDAP
jgi:hypothetical protein